MGQKVNPISFRLGNLQTWKSRWFSDKSYAQFLKEDITIRRFLKVKLREASVARLEINRSGNGIELVIHSARPGIIIGRGGTGVDELKKEILVKCFKNKKQNLKISIEEVRRPGMSAEIVLQNMIDQTEKRLPYRKIMKKAIEKALEAGCRGIKVMMSGRLNGVEIARREMLRDGRLPLHTLRADIDYARGVARTTYGAIGIKVWLYKESEPSTNTKVVSMEESQEKKMSPRRTPFNKDVKKPYNKK